MVQREEATTKMAGESEQAQNATANEETKPKEDMCCDDSGRTADQHRHEAEDGKCCVDG